MERPPKKILLPMFLIAIIVPTSLFLGFSHNPEPNISRELTVNTVEWNYTRPENPYQISKYDRIDKLITNAYKDEIVTIAFGWLVSDYFEKDPVVNTCIVSKFIFSGNLSQGFVYKVQVKFSPVDDSSYFNIIEDDAFIKIRNLSKPIMLDSINTNEPFIYSTAIGRPIDCYLEMISHWQFFDQNNVNHELTATAEMVLYTGLEYIKIQIPIGLGVLTG